MSYISSYLSKYLSSFLGSIGIGQADYAPITAEIKVINKIQGVINMTSITQNCYEEITLSCKNKDSQETITNLSLATEIIFQFKNALPSDAVIELKLTEDEIDQIKHICRRYMDKYGFN